MIPLTDEEIKFYERQKYVTYAKDIFVQIKIMKRNLNKKKSEIIAITPENLEELLIEIEIQDIKYLKQSLQYFIMAHHMIGIL